MDYALFLGALIGLFSYKAYLRKTETGDGEQKKADLGQSQMSLALIILALIAFVVMLATGH